jgi:hypothetical protein
MSLEYYRELMGSIAAAAEANGIYQEEAFFNMAAETLVEVGEISEANYAHFRQTGIRIDGFAGNMDDEGSVIKLFLLDYTATRDSIETITGSDIQTIIKRGAKFVEKVISKSFLDSIEESSDVYKLALFIRNNWRDILKIRFILITNRQMSARIKGSTLQIAEVYDTPLTLSVWDFKRFSEINAQGMEREPLTISFSEYKEKVYILQAASLHTDYTSYLSVMPGSILADIYDQYTTRLLEQNVRVYLQNRGKVNQGIINTILDSPKMFFAYNNGLTATAESIEYEETENGLLLKEIKNFQIVNGGQTVASIYSMSPFAKKRWKKGISPKLDDVYVQMKLSVVPPEKAIEVVPNISRFANSQNKVSDADFFSNHPYHVEMEKFSRSIIALPKEGSWVSTKWFYERMRGQYNNEKSLLSEAKKKEFETQFPSTQKFTKTDLAKFLTPWNGKPEIAQKGAAKCFASFAREISEKWERNNSFCNELYYKECIAKAVVFKQLEKIVSGQEWYEGGGTRAPIVLHTVGKLAHDLAKRDMVFPFITVWNRQGFSDIMVATLGRLTTFVSETILNPPVPGQLVTEWAKQQSCTSALANREFEYSTAFLELMDSKDEYRDDFQDAMRDQKLTISVDAQIFVAMQEPKFWEKLIEWGTTRERLNAKDIDIITVAKKGKIPSEKQCEYIYRVYEDCKKAGFRIKPQEASPE